MSANEGYILLVLQYKGLFCIDSKTGKKLWSYELDRRIDDYYMTGENCYVISKDYYKGDSLLEISMKDGKLRRTYDFDSKYLPSISGLIFLEDTLFICKNKEMNLFSLSEMEVNSSFPSGYGGGDRVLFDNILFYTSYGHSLSSINLKTGESWQNNDIAPKVYKNPGNIMIKEGDNIYYQYGSHNQGICAVNYKTGEILWKKEFEEKEFLTGLAINSDTNLLYVLEKTGNTYIIDCTSGQEAGDAVNIGYTGYMSYFDAFSFGNDLIVATQDSLASVGDTKLSGP